MIYTFIIEVLKIAIAGIAVVMVAFYLARPYLDNKEKLQLLDYKKNLSQQTLPLRLQGYERVMLLVDRINPASMLLRLNAPGYSAAELHSVLITEVRNEFQHNVTQQLYVSDKTWYVVRSIKDDTLNLINNIGKSLPEGASGLEMGKAILGHLSQQEKNQYDVAAAIIRAELQELF